MFDFLPKYTINLVLIISILSLIPLSHLKFDFSSENFFPLSDPDTNFYHEFQEQFQTQTDEELIFIALENKSGLFDPIFLKKTNELTQYITKLDSLAKVYSPTNATIIFFKNNQINARPLIHIHQPAMYKQDSVYLFNSPEYRDLLISENGRSIAVAAFYKKNISLPEKKTIIGSIQKKMDSLQFDGAHLISKIKVEQTLKRIISKEAGIFGLVSLIGVCLSVLLLFQSVKQAILILLLATVSALWTFSIMSLSGYDADVFSLFIPLELLIASTLNVFQILPDNFDLSKAETSENKKKKTLNVNQLLILPAGVLAATSFLLLFSHIQPQKNLGLFSGIGIVVNSILCMIFLPSYFKSIFLFKESLQKPLLHKFFSLAFNLVSRYKLLCTAILILLLGTSLLFLRKIEFTSTIYQQLPRRSSIAKDYQFIEENFRGMKPFEMALTIHDKQTSFLETDILKKVEEVENYLKDSCQVKRMISPLSLFKGANKAFNEGEISFYQLPEQGNVPRLYEAIMQTEYADEMSHYMSEKGNRMRISGGMPEISTKDFKKKHSEI